MARLSLLAVLLIGCLVAYLQPYYSTRAADTSDDSITQTVTRGPVLFDTVHYTLVSITAHTQLLDGEHQPVQQGHPVRGAVYVTAVLRVQPTDRTVVDSTGFDCNFSLIDTQGRRWPTDDGVSLSTPTDCSDPKLASGGTITLVYEVPASAVPKIVGLVTVDFTSTNGQLLIRR